MAPKRSERGDTGRGPAKAARGGKEHNELSYPRPFYQKSLTKQEIQEDIATITSGMKRTGRQTYKAQAQREEDDTVPQGGRGYGRQQQHQAYNQQRLHQQQPQPMAPVMHPQEPVPAAYGTYMALPSGHDLTHQHLQLAGQLRGPGQLPMGTVNAMPAYPGSMMRYQLPTGMLQ